MISSFFSKTKPINYLITLGFCSLLYVVLILVSSELTLDIGPVFTKLVSLVFLLLTFFAINPTLKADKLAELSSFTILFYTILLACFLPVLLSDKIIISNFLILLSTDKVLAMKFDKNITHKIFEASLFVFISTILVEWTIVFLTPVFLGVYVYANAQLRNWLMPIAAFVVIALSLASYATLCDDWAFIERQYAFRVNSSFDWWNYIGTACYFLLALAVILVTLIKLGNRGVGRILSLRLLLAYFVMGMALVFISKDYGFYAVLFTFFATAVFMTNYFETIKNKRLKESLLVILIFGSVVIAILHLIQ